MNWRTHLKVLAVFGLIASAIALTIWLVSHHILVFLGLVIVGNGTYFYWLIYSAFED